MDDLSDQLTRLAKLRADGALTEEEFKTLKANIIYGISTPTTEYQTSLPTPDRSEMADAYLKPLSAQKLAVVEQRIANEDKSVALAYVLWFFIGTLGIHNFYIGRSDRGFVELILGFGGWILVGAGTSLTGEGGATTGAMLQRNPAARHGHWHT